MPATWINVPAKQEPLDGPRSDKAVQQSEGGIVLSPQLPLPPAERKHCAIAYAGFTAYVRAAVCELCVNHSAFSFCGHTCSTNLLLSKFAHARPDIVLMDDALLNRRLTELAQLHRALPATRILLIGDSLELAMIFAALPFGMSGVLAGMRVAPDLERALHAVAGGELWLSRSQLARLLMLTTAEPLNDLPELTQRENVVMHRVMLGQSNKQIARGLDIAEHTVKIHLHHIYSKLHVHRRFELLLHYRDVGFASRLIE